MSAVLFNKFNMRLTQPEVDDLVNQLLISDVDFAAISGLYHRWFGVVTGSSDGEREAYNDPGLKKNSEIKDQFVINWCLRSMYAQMAVEVQARLENELGWLLTERYEVDRIPLHTYKAQSLQTRYPGVEKLNVVPVWHDVTSADVDIFMQSDVDVDTPYTDGTTPAAYISNSLFPNPNDVWLRNENTFDVFAWFKDGEHPLLRTSTAWRLAINTNKTPLDLMNDVVSVQSKKYVTVEIDPPTLPEGAVLYPVYPGTHQIIPQVEPMRVVEGKWQFKFYIYSLVHPEFEMETVNLTSAAEFYKLYPSIEFKYLIEETVYPRVIVTMGNEVTIYTGPETTEETEIGPDATLFSNEHGHFHLNYDICSRAYPWQCLCERWPENVELEIHYKVNPDYLQAKYRNMLQSIRKAMASLIAAELPTRNCNCEVAWGYISEAQRPYGDIVSISVGDITRRVDKVRYGNLQGQLQAAEIMNTAPQYKKPILFLG